MSFYRNYLTLRSIRGSENGKLPGKRRKGYRHSGASPAVRAKRGRSDEPGIQRWAHVAGFRVRSPSGSRPGMTGALVSTALSQDRAQKRLDRGKDIFHN